jgi:hypothetical protein
MLALYIAGGIATYLGIGLKCASSSINVSIKNGYTKDRIAKDACWAFWLWPCWFMDVGTDEFIFGIADKRVNQKQLKAAEEEELNKIIIEEGL